MVQDPTLSDILTVEQAIEHLVDKAIRMEVLFSCNTFGRKVAEHESGGYGPLMLADGYLDTALKCEELLKFGHRQEAIDVLRRRHAIQEVR